MPLVFNVFIPSKVLPCTGQPSHYQPRYPRIEGVVLLEPSQAFLGCSASDDLCRLINQTLSPVGCLDHPNNIRTQWWCITFQTVPQQIVHSNSRHYISMYGLKMVLEKYYCKSIWFGGACFFFKCNACHFREDLISQIVLFIKYLPLSIFTRDLLYFRKFGLYFYSRLSEQLSICI